MIFETHFKILFLSPVHGKRNYSCLVCVRIVNIFFFFFWPKNLEILVIISNFACEIVVDEQGCRDHRHFQRYERYSKERPSKVIPFKFVKLWFLNVL